MPTPTFTSRLVLTKPDGNPSTGDFVDIATLNANSDKIDASVGAVACTSAARPASPFNGQFARETDTLALILWNGSAWVYVATSDAPALARAFICTSVTRPASPAAGLVIYETDTGRMAIRSGAFWVYGDGTHRQRQTLGGTAASVTFSSIPSNLRSLRIKYTARGDAAATHALITLRINGSASAVYSYQLAQFSNTGSTISTAVNATAFRISSIPCANTTAGVFGLGTVDIVGWDSPHANHLGLSGRGDLLATANFIIELNGGTYPTAGPYTALTLLPSNGNFVAGSSFEITGEYS